MPSFVDLTGKTFDRLTVLSKDKVGKDGCWRWLCSCSCGRVKSFSGNSLRHEGTGSCGCIKREQNSLWGRNRFKGEHGSARQTVFKRYITTAKRRKIEFGLTKEEVISLVEKPCFYCGLEGSNSVFVKRSSPNGYYCNGVDRVDSTKGYFLDNVVPCCKFCNVAKTNLSVTDFLENIKRIFRFQGFDNSKVTNAN